MRISLTSRTARTVGTDRYHQPRTLCLATIGPLNPRTQRPLMSTAAQPTHLIDALLTQIESRGSAPALHCVRDGMSPTVSWQVWGDDVCRYAAAFAASGIGTGDHVIHWAANSVEWITIDFALQAIGAIHIPIHASLSAGQAAEQILHSEAKWVIVQDSHLYRQLQPHTSTLLPTIRWFRYGMGHDRRLLSVQPLAPLARQQSVARGRRLAELTLSRADREAVTTILYTSGTMGEPKGIMLSQRNLLSNATAMVQTFADQPREVRLNFLPLSHIFARTCDLYTWLLRGAELVVARDRDTIIQDCQRFHPTVINGVPFFFDRVRQKLEEKGVAEQPGVLQSTFGGSLEGCFSGGGALHEATYEYYLRQSIPLMQGYGLTETSPVITFSTLDNHAAGSAGQPLPGVRVKIAADGEILTAGPHVMLGYWRDPAATAETIRDGWLHTGDLGFLDAAGNLRITGRKKEMIVMATGKNVFPGMIEQLLCRDPLILQALVVGDNRDCLAALIVPDPDQLRAEIKRRRLWVFSRKQAVRHRHVVALYRERIDQQLAALSHHEQVRRFSVLDRGFTIEDGTMTAKLSLRRTTIEARFACEIESMYR